MGLELIGGQEEGTRTRGRRGRSRSAEGFRRETSYHRLTNPFKPQAAFSDDRVAAIHDTALRVLEELGMKVLLPEARNHYARAGALVVALSCSIAMSLPISTPPNAIAFATREVTTRDMARYGTLVSALGLAVLLGVIVLFVK